MLIVFRYLCNEPSKSKNVVTVSPLLLHKSEVAVNMFILTGANDRLWVKISCQFFK